MTYFLIQIFDQDVLISLVGLSIFIKHTEANPAEYVEHTSIGHWQLAWAPHKHIQLLATKAVFLLRLLLLSFRAFSNMDEKYSELGTEYGTIVYIEWNLDLGDETVWVVGAQFSLKFGSP